MFQGFLFESRVTVIIGVFRYMYPEEGLITVARHAPSSLEKKIIEYDYILITHPNPKFQPIHNLKYSCQIANPSPHHIQRAAGTYPVG